MTPGGEQLDPVRAILARLGEQLDDGAEQSLLAYHGLLVEKNAIHSLVSPSDLPKLVSRHFTESASFLRWIPTGEITVLDFGAGGGLPGIVIALLRPQSAVTLLEARRKKQVFLRLAVNRLRLARARVAGSLVEDASDPRAPHEGYDRIVARAVAPLTELFGLVTPALRRGGQLVAPKGSGADEELRASASTASALGLELVDTRRESLTSSLGERITSTVFVFAKH